MRSPQPRRSVVVVVVVVAVDCFLLFAIAVVDVILVSLDDGTLTRQWIVVICIQSYVLPERGPRRGMRVC